MSVSLALPPSGRDFLVYQRVVVDGVSTRFAGPEFNISQTRVRQIVNRVTQWLVEALPQDTDLSEAAKLRLGQHIAADRLERFYVESNRAWTQTADPKFANLCLRVIAAQAKLPAMPGTVEALAADAIFGPLADDLEQTFVSAKDEVKSEARGARTGSIAPASETKPQPADNNGHSTLSPPTRDCSPATPPVADKAARQPPASAPTSTATVPSSKLPTTVAAARNEFLAPAHSADDSGVHSPSREIKVTPQQLGLRTTRPLSRQERRRLRRLATAK